MIIQTILLAIGLYLALGLLTVLFKRNEIAELAKSLAPKLEKEIDPKELLSLEAAGVSVEQTTRWAGYMFCFLRWPAAIHTNLLEAYKQREEEKKNV